MAKTEEALKNLKAAYKILKDEKNWIVGTLALNGNDEEVLPTETEAIKFCALGAVQHVDGPGEALATDFLIEAAGKIRIDYGSEADDLDNDSTDIFEVNDGMGHGETLEMFEEAIKLAKSKLKKVSKKGKKTKKGKK